LQAIIISGSIFSASTNFLNKEFFHNHCLNVSDEFLI